MEEENEIKLRGHEWPEYTEDIPLSDQMRRFVEEYVINGFNATEAARAAGYAWPEKYAYRLVRHPKIRAAVQARFSEHIMSAEEALARLTEQARGEGGTYIDENGDIDISALKAAGKAHLIKSITDGKYGKRIEFYDAQSALALIGKYHKVFTERTENIHFDMSRLSTRQLERLASGDTLIDVLLDREDYESSGDIIEGESRTRETEESEAGDTVPEISEEIQE